MKFGTDLAILLNADYIHKDQCSRNLFNQAFLCNKSAWFLASWISQGHIPLGIRLLPQWGGLRLLHKGTLRALDVFSSGDTELQGWSFIEVLNGRRVITAAAASVAQPPSLFIMFSEKNILMLTSNVGLGHQSQKELPLRGEGLLSYNPVGVMVDVRNMEQDIL